MHIRSESSSVKTINLVTKSYYNYGDNEFFVRACVFIGIPCKYAKIVRIVSSVRPLNI